MDVVFFRLVSCFLSHLRMSCYLLSCFLTFIEILLWTRFSPQTVRVAQVVVIGQIWVSVRPEKTI
jgi:hypothetical protein